MNIYKYLNILNPPFLGLNFTLEVVDCLNIKMIKRKKILSKHCILYYKVILIKKNLKIKLVMIK